MAEITSLTVHIPRWRIKVAMIWIATAKASARIGWKPTDAAVDALGGRIGRWIVRGTKVRRG